MIVEGQIVEKYDTQTIKETFKKREFVIEYAENPQYPEFVKFELIQDKCEQLDPINVGDTVSINFNLRGRKWVDPQGETKYFNSLLAWRIDKKSEAAQNTPPPPTQENAAPPAPEWTKEDATKEDDLPF